MNDIPNWILIPALVIAVAFGWFLLGTIWRSFK
jgi:hypothetical protein